MMSERLPGAMAWPEEARAAIADVRQHVRGATVSEVLGADDAHVHINLTTLEGVPYCVEMSSAGFRVVGRSYDDTALASSQTTFYETLYALLNTVSEAYKRSFGGELITKLLHLAGKTDS
ncbi:GSK3B-interacting protein [Eumeta japonica]|uniref:GSK3B-interacting protein n=1 Tax=Eumeta variegata TaxID=151549 RepID=A0A4C1XIX8_EUMVA|nr:GSK3B-interacting protein [Eumeta japonica]